MGIPVVYSPDSLEDLENIRSYISDVLCNPTASLDITGKILHGIDSLSDSPELGPRISARFGILTDYRYLVIGRYLVVYRYTRKDVRIVRVFNGRQDYLKILFSEFGSNPE